jgi:hypothetical protein
MDQSSDVLNKAILVCYICFTDYDCNDMKEELLCCTEMPSQTTSFEIFKLINEHTDSKSLHRTETLSDYAGLRMGGANMTGRHSGV